MRPHVQEVYLRRAPGVVLSAAWLRAGFLLQRDAAKAMGASEPMMSVWCNGHAVMTAYWICRAAAAFGMGAEETRSLLVASALLDRARYMTRGVERPHPSDGPC